MMNSTGTKPASSFFVQGIGISTDTLMNLDAFTHYLITGMKNSRNGNAGRPDSQKVHGVESKMLENIMLCLKDVIQDAGSNELNIDPATLPLVIHIPFAGIDTNFLSNSKTRMNLQDIGIEPANLSISQASLQEAITVFLGDENWGNNNSAIFISTFTYISDRAKDEVLSGAAAMLLVKGSGGQASYCRISHLNTPHAGISGDRNEIGRFGDSCQNLASVSDASFIQLIGGILEVHTKSKFTLLGNHHHGENSAQNDVGRLIRPWFLDSYEHHRCQTFMFSATSYLEICQASSSNSMCINPFNAFHQYMLPLSFNDEASAVSAIGELIARLDNGGDCASISNEGIAGYLGDENCQYSLVCLGGTSIELISELERARSSIANSIETGKDWQTPVGSFFTPKPLGDNAKIAFVYPGAFNTYVGMGSELFFLFPGLYKQLGSISEDPARSINAEIIFPENQNEENNARFQNTLFENPTYMISSGVCFSFLYTKLLREYFGLEPSAAFGYSLGENSMMFAMDVWSQADAMRTSLEVSPIFHSRVSGEQRAIREFWDLPASKDGNEPASLWANYVVMAPKEKVENAIREKNKVFITHINTDRQVVIGGEQEACKEVIDTLKCMHLQAPYHHAIHCAPVSSEFDGFRHLHDWPVESNSEIPIISAANYEPLEMDSNNIADSFATMLTNQIDFPRLIDRAYQDGASVFVELGAGSNCSKWISAYLKNEPHLSVSINQVNAGDHVSIIRMLARLISHQIPLNLDYLKA